MQGFRREHVFVCMWECVTWAFVLMPVCAYCFIAAFAVRVRAGSAGRSLVTGGLGSRGTFPVRKCACRDKLELLLLQVFAAAVSCERCAFFTVCAVLARRAAAWCGRLLARGCLGCEGSLVGPKSLL